MLKNLIVEKKEEGKRLDIFLREKLKDISRVRIHNLIENKKVSVNEKIRKPSYRLKFKEKISIEIDKINQDLKPFSYPIKIIYEDSDIIVVDKPQGLVVHPLSIHHHKSLVNALIYMGKELSSISQVRKGIVHRLDKDTSGVMVVAKNNYSHLNLIEQFKNRRVKKEYYAVCWGIIKKNKLKIDLPITRDKRNRLKVKVGFFKARDAFTELQVIERLRKSTLLLIKPYTGRMHQIRVHLSFLGYPVVGDKKYGIKDTYSLLLHSCRLGFYHPKNNEFREFISPLPERFKEFIQKEKCR